MSGKCIGFLSRLGRDTRGNTLALVAASVVPLAAMVGGAMDMSRLYLVQTRLQQACDAGALAGRRSMTGLTWTADNEDTAENFFNINFPAGKYGTGAIDIEYTAANSGAVTGTASVTVPMTLMSLFETSDKTISADCTADLQLPNTDVMFVLDTTLSMNDTNPGDAQNRITVLRSAVSDFYNTLQAVKPAGSTIRYGFVPYSSTVNVGMLLKNDWIVDSWDYDSRVPDGVSYQDGGEQGDTTTKTTTVLLSGNYTDVPSTGPSEQCTAPANSGYTDQYTSWTAWSPSSTALPRSRTRERTRNGTTYSAQLKNGVCTITARTFNQYKERQTQTVSENPNAGQDKADKTYYHWIYRPVTYSLTALKGGGEYPTGGSFTAPVTNNYAKNDISPGSVAQTTITWDQTNACIEERSTRRSDEGSDVPRYDMSIDLVPDPTDSATQWRPFLPGVVYGRKNSSFTATSNWLYSGSAETRTRDVNINATTNYLTPGSSPTEYGACPTYARKLAEIDSATLTAYLALLQPAGFTYHDIGFLWGLRLMSREGLFAAEHAAAEVNGRFARHLIFMTDGETDTRISAYDAWGLSAVARRRTPTGSIPTDATQNSLTEARLTELCTIAKNNKNITVWVIAFGTTLTSLLSDCASPGRAYQADNSAELTDAFSQIASQIAQLRVTQ